MFGRAGANGEELPYFPPPVWHGRMIVPLSHMIRITMRNNELLQITERQSAIVRHRQHAETGG